MSNAEETQGGETIIPGIVPGDVQPEVSGDTEPAAAESELADTSPNIEIPQTTITLLVICCASIVAFIAAARHCDTDTTCDDVAAFAVAGSLVAFVAAVLRIVAQYCKWMDDTTRGGVFAASSVFALLQFVWWIFLVGAGTFNSPFRTVQNGFFAEWVGFLAAFYYVVLVLDPINKIVMGAQVAAEKTSHEQRYAVLLSVSSFITWLAAVVDCTDTAEAECSKEYGFAILIGVFSQIFFLIYPCMHTLLKDRRLSKWFGYFFVIWWTMGVGVMTFDKPFSMTVGNGYFGAWGSFILAVRFAMEAGTHPWPTATNADKGPAESTETDTPSVPTPDAGSEITPEVPVEATVEKETA